MKEMIEIETRGEVGRRRLAAGEKKKRQVMKRRMRGLEPRSEICGTAKVDSAERTRLTRELWASGKSRSLSELAGRSYRR